MRNRRLSNDTTGVNQKSAIWHGTIGLQHDDNY